MRRNTQLIDIQDFDYKIRNGKFELLNYYGPLLPLFGIVTKIEQFLFVLESNTREGGRSGAPDEEEEADQKEEAEWEDNTHVL